MLYFGPDPDFRMEISSEMDPLLGRPFGGGGRPENDIRQWKSEKSRFPGLKYSQTGFATLKSSFSDFRNGVMKDDVSPSLILQY